MFLLTQLAGSVRYSIEERKDGSHDYAGDERVMDDRSHAEMACPAHDQSLTLCKSAGQVTSQRKPR